jgi:hypothetical protein
MTDLDADSLLTRRTTQHIGAAGELLVQYRLLKLGVDSARLTTDSGIDLVVYSPATGSATTVQVKTVDRAAPDGMRSVGTSRTTLLRSCSPSLISSKTSSGSSLQRRPGGLRSRGLPRTSGVSTGTRT